MIFGRRRKRADDEATDERPDSAAADRAGGVENAVADEPAGPEDGADQPDQPADADEAAGPEDASGAARDEAAGEDWAALDAEQDWRHDGPFDYDEVDLAADDIARLDLGTLIVTPSEGMEVRLQVNEETQQVISALLILGESALELTLFAAPRSGGLWPEIREEVIRATTAAGGNAQLARGPFGTELRRLVTVRTEDGEDAYQPSRTWVVEGPRWLLRGVVYGQASLVDGVEAPSDAIHDMFCNLVVRRGDEAMAAGDVVPLRLPEDLVEA